MIFNILYEKLKLKTYQKNTYKEKERRSSVFQVIGFLNFYL